MQKRSIGAGPPPALPSYGLYSTAEWSDPRATYENGHLPQPVVADCQQEGGEYLGGQS